MQPSRPYPSDLSDARWELIRPTLEAWRQTRNGIRKPTHDLRALMNAILYIDRTGIPWRYLPTTSRPTKPSTATSPTGKPTASSTSSPACYAAKSARPKAARANPAPA